MNYRRNIYLLILTIIIYFSFNYVYTKIFNKNNFLEVYVISKQLSRGEVITNDNMEIIKIENNDGNKNYITKEEIGNIVSKDTYEKGQIFFKNMAIPVDEYKAIENNSEIISITLDKLDDNVSNQIDKGSIINIYYTGKTSQVKSILNNVNSSSIISDSQNESYLTFLMLENCKVLDICDSNGNEILKNNTTKSNYSLKINTVILETTRENALIINNIKVYGEFSASIVK